MKRAHSQRLIFLSAVFLTASLIALVSFMTLPTRSKVHAGGHSPDQSPASTPGDAARPALQVTPVPHLVLMGSAADIDAVTAPFVARGSLKRLRTYPMPDNWIAESPNGNSYGSPTSLQVWQPFALPIRMPAVISAVTAAAQKNNVTWEYQDTSWLSYMPQEIVLLGTPANIQSVRSQLFTNQGIASAINLKINFPNTAREIHCLTITPANPAHTVTALVNQINGLSGEVKAEPNYVTTAAGPYIHGSPGGPQLDGGLPFTATTPLTETGNGISVFIFDTVPYSLAVSTSQPKIALIDGVELAAWRSYTMPANLPAGPWEVPAHGTFVANRVTALAPQASINLVEVLDETGTGTTCHFLNALNFAVRRLRDANQRNAIFNYSLTLDGSSTQGQSPALEFAIDYLNNLRIMQVGAAGNDSASTVVPQPMRLPAVHPNVLGVTSVKRVEASPNREGSTPSIMRRRRKITCYANRGNMGVWGGGALTSNGLCNTEQLVNDCLTNPDACVTGWSPDSTTNYEWGMGTSFAAPVVTGWAAQMMEKIIAANPTAPRSGLAAEPPSPNEIRRALRNLSASDCDGNNPNSELFSLEACTLYLPITLKEIPE